MLKFILVAATVILFLVFSIPVLVWESYLGKKDPEKRDWQSLHIVQWIFRIILKMAGSRTFRRTGRFSMLETTGAILIFLQVM